MRRRGAGRRQGAAWVAGGAITLAARHWTWHDPGRFWGSPPSALGDHALLVLGAALLVAGLVRLAGRAGTGVVRAGAVLALVTLAVLVKEVLLLESLSGAPETGTFLGGAAGVVLVLGLAAGLEARRAAAVTAAGLLVVGLAFVLPPGRVDTGPEVEVIR